LEEWGRKTLRFSIHGITQISDLAPDLHFDGFCVRIDDPVFSDAETCVNFLFGFQILFATAGRKDLNDEIRSSLQIEFAHQPDSAAGNEKNIRLDDIVVGKNHIIRGNEDLSEVSLFDLPGKRDQKLFGNTLMFRIGRGNHIEVSVEDFISSILGEQLVGLAG
jgi:hypothetical protein